MTLEKPVKRVRAPKRIARSSKPIKRGKRPNPFSKKMLPKLKKKLWDLFSLTVRTVEGPTCVSCGKGGLEGSGHHAGHLFPAGSHNVLRFDPRNVHSQCYRCNINLGGNGAPYAKWFIDRYGIEEFNRMEAQSRLLKQWEVHEIVELTEAIKISWDEYKRVYAEKYGLTPQEHKLKGAL